MKVCSAHEKGKNMYTRSVSLMANIFHVRIGDNINTDMHGNSSKEITPITNFQAKLSVSVSLENTIQQVPFLQCATFNSNKYISTMYDGII